ncbi:hypothetical protein AC578_9182 [Pseudocercospora eumusae]|uniref:FAD-binding FR-type domain-containing protein n=1 Tax=Pseudocercospora eumusae TaxID=321146 RepID=A0A139HV49_9PEZI|nr:hypothetical protein AC578_9182 [Pseudocercospora eumusae]
MDACFGSSCYAQDGRLCELCWRFRKRYWSQLRIRTCRLLELDLPCILSDHTIYNACQQKTLFEMHTCPFRNYIVSTAYGYTIDACSCFGYIWSSSWDMARIFTIMHTLPNQCFAVSWLLWAFTDLVVAVAWPQPVDTCVQGCYDWTDHINWTLPDALAEEEHYYAKLCQATILHKSIYYCSQVYCTPHQVRHGLRWLNQTCHDNGGFNLPSYESIALTPAELASIQRVPPEYEATHAEIKQDVPIIPNLAWVQLSWKTDIIFNRNFWWGYDTAYGSYGFWSLAFLVGMMYRVAGLFESSKGSNNTRQSWAWFRRRILLSATFGNHCQDPIAGGTIPPRLETLLLVLYIIINFVMCFPGYELFSDNQYFKSSAIQLSRYVADRTGVLSLANVPLIWIFSARNDPLMWLTGWSYATFNRFHRWVARLSFVLAFVHSVAYSVNFGYYPGEYKASWKEEYFYCGGIQATTIMAISLGASVWYIREKSYEVFLLSHIGMAVIFLVTLWYHVQVDRGVFTGWLWPCVAIWVFDRLLRILRVARIHLRARSTKAIATYDQDSELIRLDVTGLLPKTKHLIPPGSYYYIYMPSSLRFYESHPFTICSWNSSTPTINDKQPTPNNDPPITHTFLIRPYTSFTNRLLTRIKSNPTIPILLEGPYGTPVHLHHYTNILIICGGSGITAAISHTHSSLPVGARIHVIWSIPQRRHLVEDVYAHELRSASGNSNFKMTVYLTSRGADVVVKEEEDVEKRGALVGGETDGHGHEYGYEVRHGRPPILEVMRGARKEAKQNLAIVTCGTTGFADSCRGAVCELLGDGDGAEVGYFNETMLW